LRPDDKRAFYSQPAVAEAYDAQRFGGRSGDRVSRRELALVRRLLPRRGSVLDLACGTGRLSADLARRGHAVVALDTSSAMLRLARDRTGAPLVGGDAYALPIADRAFDAVVALRLLFHYRDPEQLLREMRRIVRHGGTLVFDTYRWTPRSLLPLESARWGGKVFVHRDRALGRLAADAGLRVAATMDCFLFSPYAYRLLPVELVRALERVEARVPGRLRARTFWKLERV
jgi:SAM-dependent methyltransferase